MNRNIELKARFPQPDFGHQTARSLGAAFEAIEWQRDCYFRVAHGRLKLRDRRTLDPSGSIQQACPSQLIWYHRANDPDARASDYSLVVIERADELRDMLAGSLGVTAEVEKLRTIYLFDGVRIHLDHVHGLGSFLEFEAIVDQTCNERVARSKLDRLCAQFQITGESVIACSYCDLVRS